MNILLLSCIMNACCVKLRYHKIHAHARAHTHIYKMILNNTLNFKAQLITYI